MVAFRGDGVRRVGDSRSEHAARDDPRRTPRAAPLGGDDGRLSQCAGADAGRLRGRARRGAAGVAGDVQCAALRGRRLSDLSGREGLARTGRRRAGRRPRRARAGCIGVVVGAVSQRLPGRGQQPEGDPVRRRAAAAVHQRGRADAAAVRHPRRHVRGDRGQLVSGLRVVRHAHRRDAEEPERRARLQPVDRRAVRRLRRDDGAGPSLNAAGAAGRTPRTSSEGGAFSRWAWAPAVTRAVSPRYRHGRTLRTLS
ncbi:hypothetical protein BVI1335_2950009 [Burkholderia vietnamiensis]|nr:hypothetical protein BVI1335_2950009 [Burkholderia vietnamiensis]